MPPKITLCADDFGLSASINQGILNLAAEGRLDAVSCMTTLPLWPEAGRKLKAYRHQVQCGLHLNLTETTGVNLKTIMHRAFLRQLDQATLVLEIKRQIDAFKRVMGSRPDFIDGHEHVHQFPQVREALLQVYSEYYPQKTAWIRVSAQPHWWQNFRSFKGLVIALSGGIKLRHLLQKQAIPHNTSFSGIYDFDPNCNYAQLFEGFLQESKAGGLIMCHPGLPEEQAIAKDALYKTRALEYDFIKNTLNKNAKA